MKKMKLKLKDLLFEDDKQLSLFDEKDKYILLRDDTITVNGSKLYRIRALKQLNVRAYGGSIKRGDYGGYIESEKNLSHDGVCWVYDDAKVYQNAQVKDSASVEGEAQVYGSAVLSDSARVTAEAHVYGNARIDSHCTVHNRAHVYGNAVVTGMGKTQGNTSVLGDAKVYGNAKITSGGSVHQNAEVFGNVEVTTDSEVYGSSKLSGDVKVMNRALVWNTVLSGDEVIDGVYLKNGIEAEK
jgi:carbonic anhydrase/acetyltransferase-like protein (isoleucine patch superfamily)